MKVMGMTPSRAAERLGTDTTLVSRWRTGSRRIMPERRWAQKIARMFLEEDAMRQVPVLGRILGHYEPGLEQASSKAMQAAVERFLTVPGQGEADYHRGVVELINRTMAGEMEPIPVDEAGQHGGGHSATGVRAVRKLLLDFFEGAMRAQGERRMVILCPEGLEILVEDAKFAQRMGQLLDKAARSRFALKLILCSSYLPEGFAPLWGAWMRGHLAGQFNGYCSGAPLAKQGTWLVGVVRGHGTICVTGGESGRGVSAGVCEDKEATEACYQRIEGCADSHTKLTHEDFLQVPGGYFRGYHGYEQEPCYLMTRIPQFGFLAPEEYASFYRIEEGRAAALWEECGPLMQPVAWAPGNVAVRHIFCLNAIDDALLEARRTVPSLSALLGQRVFMTAQNLVDALKLIRELLVSHKNYEVSFLPDEVFGDLSLHIVSWGKACAVSWIAGKGASAAKSPQVAQTAHIYCQRMWERVPTSLRTRAAALRQIDQWLKKAKLYGLDT